jgi:hypothetical protein
MIDRGAAVASGSETMPRDFAEIEGAIGEP